MKSLARTLAVTTALALAPLALGSMALVAQAGHSCCQKCGCQEEVQKVCRLVCEMKEVKKVTYSLKCEDVCLRGKSERKGCEHIPTCKKIRTVRRLVKHEEATQEPAYKCVVEYLCPRCGGGRDEADRQP
jgi:hypothetical protein